MKKILFLTAIIITLSSCKKQCDADEFGWINIDNNTDYTIVYNAGPITFAELTAHNTAKLQLPEGQHNFSAQLKSGQGATGSWSNLFYVTKCERQTINVNP